MWKNIKSSSYSIKSTQNNNDHVIYVTDFVRIWCACFSKQSFLICLQTSNKSLEIEDSKLIAKGLQMIQKPGEIKKHDITIEGTLLNVLLIAFYGIPVKLKFKMEEGSKELFFQEITQHLFKTVQDLKSSENELRKLLKEKDGEIEEYKIKGGEIALRCMRTLAFDDNAHMNKHTIYKDAFEETDITESVLCKTVTVPEVTQPIVKEEGIQVKEENINNIVKLEPVSQLISSQNMNPTIQVKQEIKSESQASISSQRKRQKKLNI